jgi:hypothetical protein
MDKGKLKKKYIPKHNSDFYLEFIKKHTRLGGFDIDREDRKEGKYCLFTIEYQHIYGDSLEECIDKSLNSPTLKQMQKADQKRFNEYKKLYEKGMLKMD